MAGIDSLKAHSQYLNTALELIPAKIYFSNDGIKEKYWRKEKRKSNSQQNKAAAKLSKKLKLDPAQHKSNLDIAKERDEQEKISKSVASDEEIEQSPVKAAGSDVNSVKLAFRNKLHQLEKKRKKTSQNDTAMTTKIKKRREDSRKKAKKTKKVTPTQSNISKSQQSNNDDQNSAKSNKLLYSKFEIDKQVSSNPKVKKKKKDLQQMLKSIEDKEAKMKEIAKTDKAKATELKDKMVWKSAIEKARGNRVKDDPKLLRKTIKRQEQKKEKSKKDWNNRVQAQQNAMKERQKKRKANIKERVQRKKVKKIKKAK